MTYDDIINLPHYVSKKRPQMSLYDRAAQFSPFAALVGFDDEIEETNRQVEQFAELDENYLAELDEKLQNIQDRITARPLVQITYFAPDVVKSGGEYVTVQGAVVKIDKDNQQICFADKRKISIKAVREIILSEQ